ncbi:MAG: hypothetical protein CME07_00855 [Gemmatimonadetes bacterium]|nr:hypothetical protein [Gemmatimonadota bacterium]
MEFLIAEHPENPHIGRAASHGALQRVATMDRVLDPLPEQDATRVGHILCVRGGAETHGDRRDVPEALGAKDFIQREHHIR